MINAVGEFQNIVLFGGTSEIGISIIKRFISPSLKHLVLAARDVDSATSISNTLSLPAECKVIIIQWDAANIDSHTDVLSSIVSQIGDLDLVVMAVGVLYPQSEYQSNADEAGHTIVVNTAGVVASLMSVANQMRHQRHGQIVVISSVAAIRVRSENYVYGASKAGMDAFAQGLASDLRPSGVKVTIVRPGFVATKMTEGLQRAPFSTIPDEVSADVHRAVTNSKRFCYSPKFLRWIFLALRHLPEWIWRKI